MRPTQRFSALLPAALPMALLAGLLSACGGAGQSDTAAVRQGGAPAAQATGDGGAATQASAEAGALPDSAASGDAAAGTDAAAAPVRRTAQGAPVPPSPQANPDGTALTSTPSGLIDTANPFFAPMGNGRSCASCHAENSGWSITPNQLRLRFAASAGTDPVFRPVEIGRAHV